MGFKEFLRENEDMFNAIKNALVEMSEEDVDMFGSYLADEFFDDIGEEYSDELYSIDDVMEMITILGPDMYDEILFELSFDEEMDDDSAEDEEMDEAVARRLSISNYNRQKRKFMKTSKAELRRTKAQRKIAARVTKAKRKRYYKANKQKIASYQQSRGEAIKKGKHIVKLRKRSG